MFPSFISEAREHLNERCVDFEPIRTRDLRRMTGISHARIYALEHAGVIPKARRDKNGRLAWSCDEAVKALEALELHGAMRRVK